MLSAYIFPFNIHVQVSIYTMLKLLLTYWFSPKIKTALKLAFFHRVYLYEISLDTNKNFVCINTLKYVLIFDKNWQFHQFYLALTENHVNIAIFTG